MDGLYAMTRRVRRQAWTHVILGLALLVTAQLVGLLVLL